jgi:hypothetical protein
VRSPGSGTTSDSLSIVEYTRAYSDIQARGLTA